MTPLETMGSGAHWLRHGIKNLPFRSAHQHIRLDPRLLWHRLRTSTASHHAPRGWLPCPLRNIKRRGGIPPGPGTEFWVCFFAWLIDGSRWTLDCSCIGYGLRLFHIMHHGLVALPAAKRKQARRKKHSPQLLLHWLRASTARLAHRRTLLDPRLLFHRLQTSTDR